MGKPPASRLIDKLPAALDVPVDVINHAVEEFATISPQSPKKRLGARSDFRTDTLPIILTRETDRRTRSPSLWPPSSGWKFC